MFWLVASRVIAIDHRCHQLWSGITHGLGYKVRDNRIPVTECPESVTESGSLSGSRNVRVSWQPQERCPFIVMLAPRKLSTKELHTFRGEGATHRLNLLQHRLSTAQPPVVQLILAELIDTVP